MAEAVNPRSLVLPSDSDEKVSATQRKVLERIDWLNALRLIFNRAARDPSLRSSAQAVTVEAFLNTLLESVESLPLQEETEFRRKSSVQYFSFEEIFTSFEQEFGKMITWDFVLEKVVAMDSEHHLEESPGPHSIDVNGSDQVELVAIARKSTSSPEPTTTVTEEQTHPPRHSTYLRIPSTPNSPHTSREYSNVPDYIAPDTLPLTECEDFETSSPVLSSYRRYPRSPDLTVSSRHSLSLSYSRESPEIPQRISTFAPSLCCVSLAACGLTSIPEALPITLRVLNLAENHISAIGNLETLEHLHLLNLSFNAVESLKGLFRLKELFELYLAGNCLTKVSKVFQLQNLAMVDLSKNKIESLEKLIDLAQNRHLVVLRITGNPLCKKAYTATQIKTVLPQVQYLDPLDFFEHSAYRLCGEEVFGRHLLKKPAAESTIIEKSSLLDLSPTASKCAKRLARLDGTQRMSLSGLSQSLRSSTVRLF